MPSTVSSSRLGLAGLCILLAGQLLPMIDFSIVNVALDALAHSLGASETELELIVAVYGVAFAVCLAMGGRQRQLRPSPPVRSRRRSVRRRLVALRAGRFGLAAVGGARPTGRRRGAGRAADSRHPACQPQRPRAFPRAGRLRRHRRPGLRRRPGARRLPGLRRHRRPRLAQRVPDQPADLPRHSPLQPPLGTGNPRRACRPHRRAGHPAARRADPLPAAAVGSRPIAALVLALRPAAGGGGAAAGLAVAHRELRQERRQAWPLLPPSLRLPSIRFGLLLAILFFACWSGFMFALALALQAGAGLSPVQAGNAFIALGASYFVSALLTARVAARLGQYACCCSAASSRCAACSA